MKRYKYKFFEINGGPNKISEGGMKKLDLIGFEGWQKTGSLHYIGERQWQVMFIKEIEEKKLHEKINELKELSEKVDKLMERLDSIQSDVNNPYQDVGGF